MFLLLVFADGILQDIESSNDLEAVKTMSGDLFYGAKHKPEVLMRLVTRGIYADKSISKTRIWRYDYFDIALKSTDIRTGYQEKPSVCFFRRAFAYALASKLISRGYGLKLTCTQVKPRPLSEGH